MNKKFLSAILFGALMVTSTGTFVSCKDYDDDIDNINKELTDVKSQLVALQNKVDAGNYVTNITKAENGINVTFSNGTTNFVETAAKVEAEKVETATIVGGEWVITKVDGTKVETGIPASGILVTGDEKKGYVLSIANAEGEITEVKLPTAASSLTDLIVTTDNKTLSFANYEYTAGIKSADWKGPRTLPAEKVGDKVWILATDESPVVQLNPTTVDGEAIEFNLVDSKNNVPSYLTLKAKAYTELVTAPIARAANANGLYSLSIEEVLVSTKEYNKFAGQFTKDDAAKLYAVAAGNVRSEYEVIVEKGTTADLKTVGIKDLNGDFVKATNGKDCWLSLGLTLGTSVSDAGAKVNVGEWYNVVAVKDAKALYDMHLSANADDVTLFGIEFKEEAGSYQFRMTKTPDNITKAGFMLTVETVSMKGEYKKTYIWVGQTRIVSEGVVYDAIEHELKTDTSGKNFFSIDLAKMKDAMSAESLALWNKNVDDKTVTFLNEKGEAMTTAAGIDLMFVKAVKAKISECKEQEVAIASAKNIVFNVKNAEKAGFELNKQYTAVITFVDAADEELNTIKVPFTFTIPAITTLFEIDPGFVKEGVANLYLYEADATAAHSATSATFMLDRVFSKYEAGFTIALDDKAKVGETDKTSAQLAHLNSKHSDSGNMYASRTIVEDILAYVTLTGELGKEAGYGQVLNFIITGKFDGVWSYPEGTEFKFQAKILSPIKEGKISPKEGAAVTIKASDLNGYKFGNSVIIGNTYNSEVTYNVLQDALTEDKTAGAWSRNDISAVAAKTGNDKYFVVKETVGAQPVKTDGEVTGLTEGYFLLEGYQVDHTVETTITVSVTDIWNRTLSSEVPVKITVAE